MRLGSFKPFLLWLVALLVIHVTAPHFTPFQPVFAQAAQADNSVLDQKVLICSEKGFFYVTLADVLKKDSPYKIHKAQHCPFCGLHDEVAILPIEMLTHLSVQRVARVKYTAFYQRLAHRQQSWQRQHLRSPPAYS
jgi:hypothetical protein